MKGGDEQWKVLCELSSTIVQILTSIHFSNSQSDHATTSLNTSPSPTAFASLFLGISLSLMLFGSVTFVIGFILMPLVTGLVFLFYAIQILFNFSQFARSILCPNPSPLDFPAFRKYDHLREY